MHSLHCHLRQLNAPVSFPVPCIHNVHQVMGAAADFKVGVQNRIRERSERIKNFVPSLFRMWGYKQGNISRGLLNILKFVI